MKKYLLFPFLIFSIVLFTGCSDDDDDDDEKEIVVISFNGQLSEANSQFTTDDGVAVDPNDPYTYYKAEFKDTENLTEFNHYYSSYGFGGGFTYTNKTDKTTPGYTNISAITGTGKYGATYLTSYTNSSSQAQISLLEPDLYTLKGAWVTNTTYAYLAIKDGNDGYLNETKFEDGDYFILTFIGYDSAGQEIDSVDFYLADYREGKTALVNEWTWVDLSKIANAEVIKFEMSSTDNGDWGMNTPAYFCLDGITLEEAR